MRRNRPPGRTVHHRQTQHNPLCPKSQAVSTGRSCRKTASKIFRAIILQSPHCPPCNMYSCAAAMAGAGLCSEVRAHGGMMRITLNIVASLLVLAGAIWFLQGINVLPGSFMTGQTRWAVYGGIAVAAGIALLLAANRARKEP